MKPEHVEELSRTLPASLAPVLETSEDNFTIELVQTQFFGASYPFCEVLWFDRSAEHRQRCANWLTTEIRRITKAADIAVVFFPLEKSNYFENGKHF